MSECDFIISSVNFRNSFSDSSLQINPKSPILIKSLAGALTQCPLLKQTIKRTFKNTGDSSITFEHTTSLSFYRQNRLTEINDINSFLEIISMLDPDEKSLKDWFLKIYTKNGEVDEQKKESFFDYHSPIFSIFGSLRNFRNNNTSRFKICRISPVNIDNIWNDFVSSGSSLDSFYSRLSDEIFVAPGLYQSMSKLLYLLAVFRLENITLVTIAIEKAKVEVIKIEGSLGPELGIFTRFDLIRIGNENKSFLSAMVKPENSNVNVFPLRFTLGKIENVVGVKNPIVLFEYPNDDPKKDQLYRLFSCDLLLNCEYLEFNVGKIENKSKIETSARIPLALVGERKFFETYREKCKNQRKEMVGSDSSDYIVMPVKYNEENDLIYDLNEFRRHLLVTNYAFEKKEMFEKFK